MSSSSDWEMPHSFQPKPENYAYDLEAALTSMVGLRAIIPADAFTAETLGTERTGNGVLIREGVVLTIGYLITEAETIWLHLADGRAVPGHVLAYDQETGFGLVQALARLELPALPIGESKTPKVGDSVVVAGAGGRKHSVVARVSSSAPAKRANLRTGDVVLAVAGDEVKDLASLFRKVWSLGKAGVEVPLTIYRDGRTFEVRVTSGDRNRFLKGPSLH